MITYWNGETRVTTEMQRPTRGFFLGSTRRIFFSEKRDKVIEGGRDTERETDRHSHSHTELPRPVARATAQNGLCSPPAPRVVTRQLSRCESSRSQTQRERQKKNSKGIQYHNHETRRRKKKIAIFPFLSFFLFTMPQA